MHLFVNAGDPRSPVTDSHLECSTPRRRGARLPGSIPDGPRRQLRRLHLRPDSHYGLVRPGLAIYGLPPVPAVREHVELRPVMTFKTRVIQIKRVPAGVGVGYGHTSSRRGLARSACSRSATPTAIGADFRMAAR